jgi:hypothetical protein
MMKHKRSRVFGFGRGGLRRAGSGLQWEIGLSAHACTAPSRRPTATGRGSSPVAPAAIRSAVRTGAGAGSVLGPMRSCAGPLRELPGQFFTGSGCFARAYRRLRDCRRPALSLSLDQISRLSWDQLLDLLGPQAEWAPLRASPHSPSPSPDHSYGDEERADCCLVPRCRRPVWNHPREFGPAMPGRGIRRSFPGPHGRYRFSSLSSNLSRDVISMSATTALMREYWVLETACALGCRPKTRGTGSS